jgi:hypothetical protein
VKLTTLEVIENPNWSVSIHAPVRGGDIQRDDTVSCKPALVEHFVESQSRRFQFDLQCVSPQLYADPGRKSTALDLVAVMLHHAVCVRFLARGHGRCNRAVATSDQGERDD